MIYFTSDTHFFHENLRLHNRNQFSSIEEMNKALIDNWNRVVSPEDTVYHLGDLGWKTTHYVSQLYFVLKQLNGTKFLVKGNHDHTNVVNLPCWKCVYQYFELKYKSTIVTLMHYPIASWNRKEYGSFNFHGHTHGSFKEDFHQLDVGVDCNSFTPVSIEQAVVKSKHSIGENSNEYKA
jgi:calcineurin-like phosphoesterase family protein